MTQSSTIAPITINLAHSQLWDFAGIDGLQLAKRLDTAADRLAPFQSLALTIDYQPCSLLRLCEGNFRLQIQGQGVANRMDIAAWLQAQQAGLRVWVKQCVWMSAIALPEAVGWHQRPGFAVPKPPHRLVGLLVDRAVPARINGISVLIWRHSVYGQPAFELHTATRDLERLHAVLQTNGLQAP
jgi:hypothetical protein